MTGASLAMSNAPSPLAARPAATAAASSRLAWVDHVRATLTILVVAHHAAQAYGPTGGAWPVANDTRAPLLGVFISVNAMFFMSLFFFVSGYFTPGALARKGVSEFVRDRMRRLGVPSLLVLAATAALMERPQFLHLWFVVDLLALNLLWAAVSAWKQRPPSAEQRAALHSVDAVTTYATWLAVATVLVAAAQAAVRVRFPVDRWVDVLGVLPIEPAHWVHYASAFIAGALASRSRLLERFPDRLGRLLLGIGTIAVVGYATYRLWPGRTVSWFTGGGASWSMVRLTLLETVVCVTVGGGMLWFFRRHVARPSRFLSALADDAFGIYCVHLPLVVLVQLAIAPLPAGPLLKFALATSGALVASWLVTRFLLRRWPLGRRVF